MEFIIEKELATLNLSQLFNFSQLLTHHPASFNTAIWFSSYLGRWLLIPLRHGKPACGSLPPQRLSVRGHESWFLHHPKREHPSVHTLKGFLGPIDRLWIVPVIEASRVYPSSEGLAKTKKNGLVISTIFIFHKLNDNVIFTLVRDFQQILDAREGCFFEEIR